MNAVSWLLREAGIRFQACAIEWLAKNYGLKILLPDGREHLRRAQRFHAIMVDRASRTRKLQQVVEVASAFDEFEAVLRGGTSLAHGHRHVLRRDVQANYVVFSDHHITYAGHCQDFFVRHNAQLYADVLGEYRHAPGEYSVVENGDVEELVIFDPRHHPGQFDALIEEAKRTTEPWELPLEERLEGLRHGVRLTQYQRILSDPGLKAWLDVTRELDDDGRLIRIAGNHDFDLQKPDFAHVLLQQLPRCGRAYDYLVLEGEGRIRMAVLHGHQFDHVSNPLSGARFGETISETRGAFFQGADRTWNWKIDGPRGWVEGRQPFRNLLVRDDPFGRFDGVPRSPDPALEALRKDPFGHALLERVFDRNLAWDYFEDGSICKTLGAVRSGRRFAKFRHMDEEFLRYQMLDRFDAGEMPTVVLGHSHEPRLRPFSISGGRVFPHYVNSGAAGRFENLIWGVEISRGRPRIVSWSREESGTRLRRREWRAHGMMLLAEPPAPIP